MERTKVAINPNLLREFVNNCSTIIHNEFSRTDFISRSANAKGRNLEKECGYPPEGQYITYDFYDNLYRRSDVAKRVVDLYPDETWAVNPELITSPDPNRTTTVERAWKNLLDNPNVNPWHFLHRSDQISGIGRYSVMYLGFDDDLDPSLPVAGLDQFGKPKSKSGTQPRQNKILYNRCFTENLAPIGEFFQGGEVPGMLRGFPQYYDLILNDPRDVPEDTAAERDSVRVHWTRINHFADNRVSSELFGRPRMEPVINRILDLRKILGSSGEMFYKGGWPGYSIEQMPNVPEDLELDEDSIRDQMDKFYNNLKRYVAFVGATVKSLAPNIADPASHVEQQFRAIAAALGCPMRVLLGSEAAHLASTQDIGTWNKRIAKRQRNYVNPMVIDPYVRRLMLVGALPQSDKYQVNWKDINSLSDKDKADVALKKAQALLQYVSSGAEEAYPLMYFLVNVMDHPDDLAKLIVEASQSNATKVTTKVWEKPAKLPPGSGKSDASKKTSSGSTRNAVGARK